MSDGDLENEAVQPTMDFLQNMFAHLNFRRNDGEDREPPEKLLSELSFNGVVEYIKSDKCKKIVVMCGAGLSTAAGIPDFRSPGTGLYANLQKYDIPEPEAIFDIDYFRENPKPFFALAKELYPGQFKPTISHYFVKLLEKKGLLERVYTQNIDTLERVAGISTEKIVEAHGTFHTAHCIKSSCSLEYSQEWMRDRIFKDEVPTCDECGAYVKPDIVFFGEGLPQRFFQLRDRDFPSCDLLLVMGTSLKVQPFAGLTGHVKETTPRVLINREKCKSDSGCQLFWGYGSSKLDFDSEKAYRDVALLGDCDDQCSMMAEKLGWKEELDQLVRDEHAKIDDDSNQKDSSSIDEDNSSPVDPTDIQQVLPRSSAVDPPCNFLICPSSSPPQDES